VVIVLHGQQRACGRWNLSRHNAAAKIQMAWMSWSHLLDVSGLVNSTPICGDMFVRASHSELAITLERVNPDQPYFDFCSCTHLTVILTRLDGIGMEEGTRLASLTGSLSIEFAGHM
jgi:hypothetical protein